MTAHPRTRRITFAALFAALMCVSAQLRVPLGPVPLTLQSFTACTAGYVLGPAGGVLAMVIYAVVGLAGLPVFASGGGIGYVLSPTFGYIPGFVACAAVTGHLAPLNRRGSTAAAWLVMAAGVLTIYIPGVLWLMVILRIIADAPVPAGDLLGIGLLIPLPGDLLASIPAAALSVRLRKKLVPEEHTLDQIAQS